MSLGEGSVPRSRRASVVPVVLFALAALLPGAGCAEDAEVAPFELRGGAASVRVSLEPFELTILDARGGAVLRTLTGGASDAYGSPSATRDEGIDNVKVIPGWDAFVPDEKGWAHASAARLLERTDASASFELRTEQGTLTVTVKLEGAKVTLSTTSGANESALEQDVARVRARGRRALLRARRALR